MGFPALQSCDDCGGGVSKAEAQGEMLGRNNAELYWSHATYKTVKSYSFTHTTLASVTNRTFTA